MFQKDKFWEKQKFIYGKPERNTFCVSRGKTLWKSQNVSLNGFFRGKHHPVPAVLPALDFVPHVKYISQLEQNCLNFNSKFALYYNKHLEQNSKQELDNY